MQLLVLGCHRSGTSAVTRLLNMMGASVGAPESMKAANKENSKGFWENDEVVDINKLLLQQAGARWDRLSTYTPEVAAAAFAKAAPTLGKELERLLLRFDVQRPWVTKDPRLCLTLPFWLPYMEAPVAILVNRHPVEVARSMHRRNPLLTIETGIALWEKHTLAALADSLAIPRISVTHEDVMRDPADVVYRLLSGLEARGVTGLRLPSPSEVQAFIDPKLHREHRNPEDSQSLLNPEQRRLLDAMESGEALGWASIPPLSSEAQAALEAYDANANSEPERLLAYNRWNLSRLIDTRTELLETTKRLAKLEKESAHPQEEIQAAREKLTDNKREVERLGKQLAKEIAARDELRAKYAERCAIEAGYREEAKSLRHALQLVYKDLQALNGSRWTSIGSRIKLLKAALRTGPLTIQLPADHARTIYHETTEQSDRHMRELKARAQRAGGKAATPSGTKPNRHAYQEDIAKLRALFDRMAWCEAAFDTQWWWRMGITLRQTVGVVGVKRDVIALSKSATDLRHNADAAFKHADGRARRSQSTAQELDRDLKALQDLIEQMYAIIQRRAGGRWWRNGIRVRKAAGALGLMKPDFRLPTTDAALAMQEYAAFREAQKKSPRRYLLEETKAAATVRRALPTPVAAAPLAALPENALYFEQVAALRNQNNDGLAELIDTSEATVSEYRTAYACSALPPLVSIIMPAYNRADLIGQALRSVREQTWQHWELLVCDDGSTDSTVAVASALDDPRIHVLELEHGGAAKARNAGLAVAQGEYIAYLDSDNLWHPAYLEVMIGMLLRHAGHYAAFAKYLDVVVDGNALKLKRHTDADFSYEQLQERNFVDLNSFVHRASLYREFGGFTDALPRMQDWDLVLKYTFLRDPLYVDAYLAFYRRNEAWGQITHTQRHRDDEARALVQANVAAHYETGMPVVRKVDAPRKVTILSWDICRNHFSKAYNLAEALHRSGEYTVQLIGFRFFDEPIFEPYVGVEAPFETLYIDGANLPDFEQAFARALMAIKGDLVYCVKPRFPSLGLGLLANYHFGKPVVMESNDSEVHVHKAGQGAEDQPLDPATANPADPAWANPYSLEWSRMMDGFARDLPWTVTHNKNLDAHYGARSFYIRNLKDETWFNPARYDRNAIRKELGFKPTDRVILFGGLVRKHKGVFTLIDLVHELGDQYKLLFVGSRNSPDLDKLKAEHSNECVILPPQDRNEMAKINYAADLVVLWLDPEIPASHYQMPYKLTDALAMKAPVIANDISDLGDLGRQGYLRLVPHGDMEALVETVRDLFQNREETTRMVEAGRRLYLRQFCYAAARRNFDLIWDVATREPSVLPVSATFAEWYARVHKAQHS
jgi:glycosyltransferase involved in cell wall biosynthesis